MSFGNLFVTISMLSVLDMYLVLLENYSLCYLS